MRVALVNPNTSAETTATMVVIARQWATNGMLIEGITAPFGVALITNPTALAVAADAVESLTKELATFDGVIVAAFGDPGRDRLAARLPCPVLGIVEASMEEAARRSNGRFSVVTTTPDLADSIRMTAAGYGHGQALISVRTATDDPMLLMASQMALDAALTSLIDQAIEVDQARAIVIGGGPLAQAARRLGSRFTVPIIEPIAAAIALMQRRLNA
jgi:allantoin racemase